MSNNTLMSVAHAGGQGKTTVAQLLYLASKRLSDPYKVVAADFLDETGRSKLGKLYPGQVEEFGVGAALTAARTENNPNAPLRYWDKLGYAFLNGGHIVDVGANVIDSMLDWAADRHVAKLMERKKSPKVDFFCVCKAERHAVESIADLVRKLVSGQHLRYNRIFIVENEVGGSFASLPLREQVAKAAGSEKLTFISLPKCQSEIWPSMEKKGMSIERALVLDEDDIVDMLDVDLFSASSGIAELRSWFENVVKIMREAEVFSSGRGAAAEATPLRPAPQRQAGPQARTA